MLVLSSTVFLLFGAPAILLLAGRLIQSKTDALHRTATPPVLVLSGSEWYFRPSRPFLGEGGSGGRVAAPARPPTLHEGDRWFHRPLPPLFVWPDLRRLFRRPRRAATA